MTGTDRPAVDVVVVGAGLAGLYAVHRFRRAGLTLRVFEAGDDIGGTWHWNRYPGATIPGSRPCAQTTSQASRRRSS